MPLPRQSSTGPCVFLTLALVLFALNELPAQTTLPSVISDVQPKMVKIYGAGGIRGLESYQSGFLISEEGHILTAWSYVLDTDYVTAVLDDGRKFKAETVGADPRSDIAVLKIDIQGAPHFSLPDASSVGQTGDRVLAFSNLYGIAAGNEPSSVLHGHISAKTDLKARKGVFETTYNGPVYVLDAMTNNAGAAGGALTDFEGNLLGMLGKELLNSQTNTWLNFALPITDLKPRVDDILAGRVRRDEAAQRPRPADHHSLQRLGIVLIPNVLVKTPPFVEKVDTGSPAASQGLQPDDLVLFVGPNMVQSRNEMIEELSYIDRLDAVKLTVLRDQELIEFELISQD